MKKKFNFHLTYEEKIQRKKALDAMNDTPIMTKELVSQTLRDGHNLLLVSEGDSRGRGLFHSIRQMTDKKVLDMERLSDRDYRVEEDPNIDENTILFCNGADQYDEETLESLFTLSANKKCQMVLIVTEARALASLSLDKFITMTLPAAEPRAEQRAE